MFFRIDFNVMEGRESRRHIPGFRRFIKKASSRLRSNQTPAENLLWSKIRGKQIHGLRFRRQHPLLNYIVDFYCASKKLVIEVDGGIHDFHIEDDILRQKHLEQSGFTVIRFTNDAVTKNIQSVLEKITRVIQDE